MKRGWKLSHRKLTKAQAQELRVSGYVILKGGIIITTLDKVKAQPQR